MLFLLTPYSAYSQARYDLVIFGRSRHQARILFEISVSRTVRLRRFHQKPQAEIDRIAREVLTNPVIEGVQFQARELNHLSEAPAPSLTKRRDQPYHLLHGTPL